MAFNRLNEGHWSIIVAVVGCLISGTGIAEPHGDSISANPDQKPQADQHNSNPPASIQYQDSRQTGGYRADCRKPQSPEDSDLCAQWGSVEGVRQANRIASTANGIAAQANEIGRSGLWLTGFEFAALVATLGATAWAASAAARAARAAEDSVTAAKDIARKELRAYLFVEKGQLNDFGSKKEIKFSAEMRNTGQMPAHSLRVWGTVCFASSDAGDIISISFEEIVLPVISLGAGSVVTIGFSRHALTDREKAWMAAAERVFYIHGGIEYVDCFDEKQTGVFRFYRDDLGSNPHKRIRLSYARYGNKYS